VGDMEGLPVGAVVVGDMEGLIVVGWFVIVGASVTGAALGAPEGA